MLTPHLSTIHVDTIHDFIGNSEMPVDMKNEAMRALEALTAAIHQARQGTQPLDMPDSPGWWAYKGEREGVVCFDNFKVKGDNVSVVWRNDIFPMTYTVAHFKQFMGNPKFYRLTMPWSNAQP